LDALDLDDLIKWSNLAARQIRAENAAFGTGR
jgi:hypothetical protein